MKRLIFTSTLFGLLTAASAFAQPRFNVPFDFQAGGRAMSAGRYVVSAASAVSNTFIVKSQETGRAAMVLFPVPQTDPKAAAPPRLVFQCAARGKCEIAEVWTSSEVGAGRVVRPKPQAETVMVGAE